MRMNNILSLNYYTTKQNKDSVRTSRHNFFQLRLECPIFPRWVSRFRTGNWLRNLHHHNFQTSAGLAYVLFSIMHKTAQQWLQSLGTTQWKVSHSFTFLNPSECHFILIVNATKVVWETSRQYNFHTLKLCTIVSFPRYPKEKIWNNSHYWTEIPSK